MWPIWKRKRGLPTSAEAETRRYITIAAGVPNDEAAN
jgi:hypothetical protein